MLVRKFMVIYIVDIFCSDVNGDASQARANELMSKV